MEHVYYSLEYLFCSVVYSVLFLCYLKLTTCSVPSTSTTPLRILCPCSSTINKCHRSTKCHCYLVARKRSDTSSTQSLMLQRMLLTRVEGISRLTCAALALHFCDNYLQDVERRRLFDFYKPNFIVFFHLTKKKKLVHMYFSHPQKTSSYLLTRIRIFLYANLLTSSVIKECN